LIQQQASRRIHADDRQHDAIIRLRVSQTAFLNVALYHSKSAKTRIAGADRFTHTPPHPRKAAQNAVTVCSRQRQVDSLMTFTKKHHVLNVVARLCCETNR
jgi:hypothetical protein